MRLALSCAAVQPHFMAAHNVQRHARAALQFN